MSEISIILMQKNEDVLLPIFVDYYGEIFGYSNIYILDNGSDKHMTNLLAGARRKGSHIISEYNKPENFSDKGEVCKNFYVHELGAKGVFLPLDCDEFLVAIENQRLTNDPQFLKSFFGNLDDGMYKIAGKFRNNPYKHNEYYHWPHARDKLFFKNFPPTDLCRGYHECAGDENSTKLKGLFYFEFHNRDYQSMITESENKLKILERTKFSARYPSRSGNKTYEKYLTFNCEADYKSYIERCSNGSQKVNLDFFERMCTKMGYEIPWTI